MEKRWRKGGEGKVEEVRRWKSKERKRRSRGRCMERRWRGGEGRR